MNLRRWVIGLALSGLLLVGATARAQDDRRLDSLNIEIVRTTARLIPAQIELIEQFARHWVGQLADAKGPQIAEARGRLLEPMRTPGASEEYFKPAYAAAVARLLPPVLASKDPMLKLNTMVVAAEMADPAALAVIEKALADENAAVRYWAGKTATNLGHAARLSGADEAKLIGLLAAAAVQEKSRLVLSSVLLGLASLNMQQAGPPLLKTLNARMPLHAKDPLLSPTPEFAALRELLSRLVPVYNPTYNTLVREALRTLFRYTHVSAQALADAQVAGEVRQEHRVLVEGAEVWLTWCVQKLANPSVTLPASFAAAIQAERWAELQLLALRWKDLLKEPPISLTDADLATQ